MGFLQGSASDPHRDPYRIHIGSMYGPQRGPCFAITVFCWGNFAGGEGGSYMYSLSSLGFQVDFLRLSGG